MTGVKHLKKTSWFTPINQQGFTLMELITAMAVFLTVMTVGVSVFLQTSRSDRAVRDEQQVYADLAYVLERISREVRFGELELSGSDMPQHSLSLSDQNGNRFVFTIEPYADCPEGVPQCIIIGRSPNATAGYAYAPMTSPATEIVAFDVYTAPSSDPFVEKNGVFAADEQPRVTLVITGKVPKSEKVFTVQTTVSTRTYKR